VEIWFSCNGTAAYVVTYSIH